MSSTMFSEDELTEAWVDEQCQKISHHSVHFKGIKRLFFMLTNLRKTGPFDTLPIGPQSPFQWKELSGTEGRYQVALSRKPAMEANTTEVTSTSIELYLSIHLKQKYWPNASRGVTIIVKYQI